MVNKRESDRKAFTKKYESTRDKLIKKCQETRTNLRNLSLNFNGKMDEMNDLQIQLNLYRDMHGITELTDFNLGELEKHLWAKVDDIKVEKARRVIHKQTGALPAVQGAFIQTQNDPVPIPSEDEIWNSSEDTDTSSNQDLKDLRSVDEEAELFKELFKRGLEDVEAQLEEVRKLNIDIDRDGQNKEKKLQNHKKDKESISLKDIPKSAQKKGKDSSSGLRNGPRGLRSSCGQLDFKLDLINNVPENFNEQDINKYKNIKKTPTQVRQDKGKDTLGSSRSKERLDVREEPTRDFRNRPDVSPDVVSSSKFSTRILEESMIKLNETTKELAIKNLLKDVKLVENSLMKNNNNSKMNSTTTTGTGVRKTTSASKMALDAAKDKLQKSATSKLISSRIASTDRTEYQRDNLSGNKKTSSSAKKEEVGLTRIQKMLLLDGGDNRGRNDVSQNLSFKRSATNSGAKSVDKSNNKRKKETENVKTDGEEDRKERAELAMYQRQLNNREDISVSDFRTSINIQEGIREHSEENYSCQDENNKTSLEISHLEDLPARNSKDMTPSYSPYYTQRDGEVTIANMTAIKFYDTVSQISEMNGYLSSEFRKSHHNQSMEGDDYTMSELNQTMGDETKRRRSRADRQKRRRVENEI